ncbi:uncharacterized protein LOC116164286 [Photinus pyralis]|uniref:uncharacterized protein LOC116164286 n=1 Tax=Photinus pyralis TaxID=7054 RepID=UPI001266E963|nr:uncharacterized protein LOC116164286 [Photinus pyralis]
MILTAILTLFLIKDGIAYKDCDGHDRFPDYYWREYKGMLPVDALPGGYDTKGQTTYIGQMHDPKYGLLPAVVYADTKTLSTMADGQTRSLNKNAKILCTGVPSMFKWIPTDVSAIHQLAGYHLVVAGTELDQMLYVGRTKLDDGELRVGKVFEYHDAWKGLNLVVDGKGTIKTKFEILVYDFQDCANL